MGLDKMGLDEMGINRWVCVGMLKFKLCCGILLLLNTADVGCLLCVRLE